MTHPLIVPMNLRALAITENGETFLGPSADFSRLPSYGQYGTLDDTDPFLASSIERYPDRSPRLGVKLHWSLPATLRHGRRAKDGSIIFPAVPNRWLITRVMLVNDEQEPRFKSWVLEADRVDQMPQPGSSTIPLVEKGRSGRFFRYLGRWRDYSDWWVEPVPSFGDLHDGSPLTAVGYGDPLFAAYAPNCPNVFAFDDVFEVTLAQQDSAGGGPLPPDPFGARYRLTYVVTGWYTPGNGDPLESATEQEVREDQRWSWPAGEEAPQRTLVSGSVLNLDWSLGQSAELPPAPAVSVGTSAAEALSAMVGGDPTLASLGSEGEFILNAIQAGVFKRLFGHPGWTKELEADLHRKGFMPSAGGAQWAVLDARNSKAGMSAEDVQAAAVELSREQAEALAVLNGLQAEYDKRRFRISSARRQLFADWYRRQLLTTLKAGDEEADLKRAAPALTIENAGELLRACIDNLREDLAELGELSYGSDGQAGDAVAAGGGGGRLTLAAKVVDATVALKATLPDNLRLRRLAAPRFWRPADPVILLQGPAAAPPNRDGRPEDLTREGHLPCRLTKHIPPLDGATDARATLQKVAGIEFARLGGDVTAWAPAEALLLEAMAWSGAFDEFMNKRLGIDLSGWRRSVAAIDPRGTPAKVSGKPSLPSPQAARTDGTRADWTPVMLEWKLRYRPLADAGRDGALNQIDPKILLTDHSLDPAEVELCPVGKPAGEWAEYRGWTALSSLATLNLRTAILNSAEDGDDAAAAIAGALKDAPIMAQAAGGFHEALLMFDQAPQLRVTNPNEPHLPLAEQVALLAGMETGHAPLLGSLFAPLRSGEIELTEATVVDVWGRRVRAAVDKIFWSASYRCGERPVLPPRFSQPARLQFRWLSAATGEVEASDHPESSPICGWVVPNFVGGSLDIFTSDGLALGSLFSAHGVETLWRPAPRAGERVRIDSGDPDAQTHSIQREIKDRELRQFVLAVLDGEAGYLRRLIDTIDTAVGRIIPADPGAAPLILAGRPLALVRAGLSFELKGSSATDQGWSAMATAVQAAAGEGEAPSPDHGLASVKVPVHLGKTEVFSDGLVGHFLFGSEDGGYGRFRSAAAADGGADVVKAEPLAIAAADPPVTVAMLIDPRTKVHATTGILPVKAVSVPPTAYAAARNRLSEAFFAGPMLFPPGDWPLPLPVIPNHRWEWLHAKGDHWASVAPSPPSDDRARTSYDLQRLEDGWAVLNAQGDTA